jgi:hypothetical protein
MAKTTTCMVALAVAALGPAGCGGDNVPGRKDPPRVEVPLGIADACKDTTPEGSSEWSLSFELCQVTTTGRPVAKREPCTEEDQQVCWKTCGPMNIGFKQLTCSGGAYVEDSQCIFDPHADFSCFAIPEPEDVHPDCPTTEAEAPRHNEACTLPPCRVCGGNTYEQTTGYRNSSEGLLKPGYCVCRPAVYAEDGTELSSQKWQCATMGTAWPCPNGCGC